MHEIIQINSMNIPERVSRAIEKSGYDDEEIAKMIVVSPSTVNRWRNGVTKEYGKNRLRQIASALNVSYEWLRFGRGTIDDPGTNDPKVQYADSIDLPEDGQLSKDQMRKFLGQIESIAQILKDSLK